MCKKQEAKRLTEQKSANNWVLLPSIAQNPANLKQVLAEEQQQSIADCCCSFRAKKQPAKYLTNHERRKVVNLALNSSVIPRLSLHQPFWRHQDKPSLGLGLTL
jgi:hypothetical protein